MSFIKYARVEIVKVGELRDVVKGTRLEEVFFPSTMKRLASLDPIINFLDDFIYTRQRSVSAFERYGFNGNWDGFPGKECIKSHASFINTGFFKDHVNYDKKLAYGINLDARYHPDDFIETISAIGKKLQKDSGEMVENILANKWNQVSMGANINYSICSICGNKAYDVEHYCDCIKYAKGSKIDGKDVGEINYGLDFFEQSCITTEAADKDAHVVEVFTKEDLKAMTAAKSTIMDMIRTPHIKESGKSVAVGVTLAENGTSEINKENTTVIETNKVEVKPMATEGKTSTAATIEQMKDNVSQQSTAADYDRSKDPTAAAVAEAKAPSDSDPKPTVAAPENVSQAPAAEDYPHKSAAKVSLVSRIVSAVMKSLGGDDVAEEIAEGAEDGSAVPVGAVVEVREMRDELNKKLDQVEDKKEEILAKLKSTKLASVKKLIQADLDDLHEAETDLVEVRQAVEDVAEEIKKKPEEDYSKDMKELNKEVTEVIECADDLVKPKPSKEEIQEVEKLEADFLPVPGVEASKKPVVAAVAAEDPVKPVEGAQSMADKGDYPQAPESTSAAGSDASKSGNATQTVIEKERAAGFATPSEQQAQQNVKTVAMKLYREFREHKVDHKTALAKVAVLLDKIDFKKLALLDAKELQNAVVKQVADVLVDRIMDANPESPESQAVAATVGEPPVAPSEELKAKETQEMFGTAPVAVSSSQKVPVIKTAADVGTPSSDETSAPKVESISEDPSSPDWDLFPEDRITSAVGEANAESKARLTQDLKGTAAQGDQLSTSHVTTQALFNEEEKVLDVLNLAQEEVNAGLIDAVDIESEAQRLYRVSPEELKGVKATLQKLNAKKDFAHPDGDDPTIVTQAMSLGGIMNGETAEGSLFED